MKLIDILQTTTLFYIEIQFQIVFQIRSQTTATPIFSY